MQPDCWLRMTTAPSRLQRQPFGLPPREGWTNFVFCVAYPGRRLVHPAYSECIRSACVWSDSSPPLEVSKILRQRRSIKTRGNSVAARSTTLSTHPVSIDTFIGLIAAAGSGSLPTPHPVETGLTIVSPPSTRSNRLPRQPSCLAARVCHGTPQSVAVFPPLSLSWVLLDKLTEPRQLLSTRMWAHTICNPLRRRVAASRTAPGVATGLSMLPEFRWAR